jgi:RNA polymerase sigma-70 factor, ECF subfamily
VELRPKSMKIRQNTRLPQSVWEKSLINRLRLNDQEAFEELASHFSERLRREALHFVRDWEDANDVVQQTLWKAWSHFPQYRGDAGLYTWLSSIARNESLVAIRKRKAGTISLDNPNSPGREIEQAAAEHRLIETPEQLLEGAETARALRLCLDRLHPRTRQVLKLRWGGRAYAEIGICLHLSTQAAKLRFLRGRKKLRKMLTCELSGACFGARGRLEKDPQFELAKAS